ncbi:hypothetical protein [Kitasatospora sp. NPDC058218]|uniref:hypothetical protein n=1 Tax=Kitasatospora sp. NPDC058218 TaxID=3346385 RepID=UPI0036D9E0AD
MPHDAQCASANLRLSARHGGHPASAPDKAHGARYAPHRPLSPQAECLAAFAALRAGTPRDAFEIGEGCNVYPPAPSVGRHLANLLHGLAARGSLSRYADPFRGGARAAFADLLATRLGLTLTAEDISFVQGGTEAISLITNHLATTGHSLTLPLPNYYGFEQSTARWGAPVERYYRHDGLMYHCGTTPGHPSALVDVLPNGVTGTRSTPAPASTRTAPSSTSSSSTAPCTTCASSNTPSTTGCSNST